MELSRRDALAALAAGGVAVGGGAALYDATTDDGSASSADPSDGTEGGVGHHERETLVAVADVVYPSAVTGTREFVETYLEGRTVERPDYAAGAAEAVAKLDDLGESWHGSRFIDLEEGSRERLLREVGADTADPDPDGSPAERVRYYLVNELLYALYTSPTGGELVGIANPRGHSGGVETYQRRSN
jgi:hypothetical protein